MYMKKKQMSILKKLLLKDLQEIKLAAHVVFVIIDIGAMTDLKKGGKNSSYIFPQEFLQSMQSQVVGQLLDANPQLKQLLEANPEVKIVLPDMTKTGSNGRSPATESIGHSSTGAHSDNRLVHIELNDGMEEENHIQWRRKITFSLQSEAYFLLEKFGEIASV